MSKKSLQESSWGVPIAVDWEEKKIRRVNILPWIADGSYLSEEYQRKIEATIKEICGDAEYRSLRWDLHNRTVI